MTDHPGRRRLWMHVGCSKTGTSSLQAGLWMSVEALAAEGVGLPFVGRPAHIAGLLRPLGWRPVDGFADDHRPKALGQVPATIRDTGGDVLLVSNEDLAEARSEDVDAIATLCAEAEVDLHLVLTVRDWAQQLPSDYQQFLKHRLADSYPEFLDDVRERRGPWADQFWRRQDPVDILDRWGRAADASRTHVIVVPSYSQDPDGVFNLMGEVVGFPSAVVNRPKGSVNASFGVVESEVFRRVNAALGDRLPDYKRDYIDAVRWPFANGVLARSASPRLTLPPEHLDWVQEVARRGVATVRERGYRVHGDLDALVPDETSARPLPAYDEAAVAEASITALANYAAGTARRKRS
ncbi:hypothetical protein [Nocardioides bizhenqiangii]|uniref:Sulfotransferase family protein n=1 Tax=Nocardioides bizhenqiangii TaxID=3095076 RepID=A0ABZ0ZU06_9ACTN|nr:MULTISPECIES: hypothetical protein [unclassified Nocardioides]MDZ5623582.1 hypothetical protein [Nocardioides sp. HM23]WQQ27806.1 hypothetical protein SHK19_06120 [Nocardioides sp. HM61]